jgi:uncharacterized membrane protein
MTAFAIFLCLLVQVFLVVGQLLLKHAMSPKSGQGTIIWRWLILGMFSFSLWFFIWLGILSKWDLSQVFPFEGLNAVLIAITAAVLLKEKLPVRGWIGIALISAGIMLVSAS